MELLAGPAAPKWLISSNEVTFARTLTDAQDHRNGPRCENGSATSAEQEKKKKKKKNTRGGGRKPQVWTHS